MRIIDTAIPDVKILEPRVFSDDRGFFLESYNEKSLAETLNLNLNFVQDNHSHSIHGVLRGLHYQLQQPQGKLVRVVTGEAFDVAVDLRKSSPTFGHWIGVHLSETNKHMLWIPPGFAHGFLTLSPRADFLYKTTDYYNPASEHTIIWNDVHLGIRWPYKGYPNLSTKDRNGLPMNEAPVYA